MNKEDEIKRLLKDNLSYTSIGKILGISRQRVHQIIKHYKSPSVKYCSIFKKEVVKFAGTTDYVSIAKIEAVKSMDGGRDRHREIIRIRDNHTCQICGKMWMGGRKFDVHHLDCDNKKSRQCDNLEREKNNLITLCHKCHLNLPEHRKAMMWISRNNC